jgi:L-alanine-DL-glutamate epimerase-like enolase superfamily enzyme
MRVRGVAVYFLPVETRMPLKFGKETLTSVTCCRICVTVSSSDGRQSFGWGETPLSVQWGWPAEISYSYRQREMLRFCLALGKAWTGLVHYFHPLELGSDFQEQILPEMLRDFNLSLDGPNMPYLAALICLSAFDIAVHDAHGRLHGVDIYDTYTADFMSRDLSSFLTADPDSAVDFRKLYPASYLDNNPPTKIVVWHLVGALDPLDETEMDQNESIIDGYPVHLADWIRSDGLKCLKVKLRGNDLLWDFDRLRHVARISLPLGVEYLSADFNCTVTEPEYVSEVLDRLNRDVPQAYARLLYIEQPFPYDLEAHPYDVRGLSNRKPLFLDESAHDWRYVRLGRSLGWTGVALKTCKTQTGSILSCCWAKAHNMQLMVQDLTNPMLAQIPHVRLAAHAKTLMGVESNAVQFYPEASRCEAAVHPGLYKRCQGQLSLDSIYGDGFGYRIDEINRELPEPAGHFGEVCEPSVLTQTGDFPLRQSSRVHRGAL